MQTMIRWLSNNKEWVFSGIGVLVISVVATAGFSLLSEKEAEDSKSVSNNQELKSGSDSNNIQIQNNSGEVNINLPTPEPDGDWLTVKPIEYLDEKLHRIELPSDPPNVSLRFVSSAWDIDYPLLVSKSTSITEIKDALLTQLAIPQHVTIDYSQLPTTQGECGYQQEWLLKVNGKFYSPFGKDTLDSIQARDDDILQLYLDWFTQCAFHGPAPPAPESFDF